MLLGAVKKDSFNDCNQVQMPLRRVSIGKASFEFSSFCTEAMSILQPRHQTTSQTEDSFECNNIS